MASGREIFPCAYVTLRTRICRQPTHDESILRFQVTQPFAVGNPESFTSQLATIVNQYSEGINPVSAEVTRHMTRMPTRAIKFKSSLLERLIAESQFLLPELDRTLVREEFSSSILRLAQPSVQEKEMVESRLHEISQRFPLLHPGSATSSLVKHLAAAKWKLDLVKVTPHSSSECVKASFSLQPMESKL